MTSENKGFGSGIILYADTLSALPDNAGGYDIV